MVFAIDDNDPVTVFSGNVHHESSFPSGTGARWPGA